MFLDIALVTHIDLNLDIDFEKQILKGFATLEVEKVDSTATQVILDARGLNISGAVDFATGQKLNFKLYEEDYVGSKLEVQLPTSKDKRYSVIVCLLLINSLI